MRPTSSRRTQIVVVLLALVGILVVSWFRPAEGQLDREKYFDTGPARAAEVPMDWGRLVTVTVRPEGGFMAWYESGDGTVRGRHIRYPSLGAVRK
jgi:hypothetical protein